MNGVMELEMPGMFDRVVVPATDHMSVLSSGSEVLLFPAGPDSGQILWRPICLM